MTKEPSITVKYGRTRIFKSMNKKQEQPKFNKETFDKAALAWQKDKMVNIQEMIRQRADQIAREWEKEFKEQK